MSMTFEKIIEDGRLWAVRYDGETENALGNLFEQWSDVEWLRQFFKENMDDLTSYFKITDVNDAIWDTLEDSDCLQCLIMDISPEADLDKLFMPLENYRTADMVLGMEKARLKRTVRHSSWLRIYAIKLADGVYIITGGAIKLTLRMDEREHTKAELAKMEKVRRYLLDENIIDDEGFVEKLEQHQPETPSKWREKAEFRLANKSWLRYSQHVAMMMLDKMEEIGLNQRGLAERLGCTQQYVSKILKGRENLSIETICKIEDALELELLPKAVEKEMV